MTKRISYVLRIASDPVCYVWTGYGDLETPADIVDPAGATWLGAGGIIALPALRVLIGGVAERVEFTLSGVDAETLRLAQEDRDTVDGADVRLGFVEFDQNWSLTGPPSYDWRGRADVIMLDSTYGRGDRTRIIRLSVASVDNTRANPRFSFWTDSSQKLRSNDDNFCDHVATIFNGITRRFGPK